MSNLEPVRYLTRGSGSVVEHLLAKEKVASSNLVFRSERASWEARFSYPANRAEMAERQTLRS